MTKRGGQKGNTNATKGKRLSGILRKRLEERAEEDALMNVLLDKALDGDLQAIKEVFDRIDGKANQSLDIQADITATEKMLTNEDIQTLARELNEDC